MKTKSCIEYSYDDGDYHGPSQHVILVCEDDETAQSVIDDIISWSKPANEKRKKFISNRPKPADGTCSYSDDEMKIYQAFDHELKKDVPYELGNLLLRDNWELKIKHIPFVEK